MGGMTHCANCGAEVPVDMPHRVGECNHPPMTLADFILARIADDEAVARTVVARMEHAPPATIGGVGNLGIVGYPFARVLAECEAKRAIVEWHSETEECCEERYGPFVLEADPQLGVGTSASGDLVVSQSFGYEPLIGCVTLMMLALPYADHEDYDEGWRP